MKTIHMKENNELVKRYASNDGTVYEMKELAVEHDKRQKTIANIKEAYATVFDNSDEVVNSLIDGLQRMLEFDRRTVLNGLINLTIEKKPRKNKIASASTEE